MIKIVLVGSGGSVPSLNRAMPCLALKYDKLFLFDIGEGTQRELIRTNLPFGSVNSIFISHLHLDHFLGVYGLLETLRLNNFKGKVRIFAPKGFRLIKKFDFVEITPIENDGKLFSHRDFEVFAFRTNHEKDSFGFKVKFRDKLVFIKDKLKELELERLPGIMFKKLLEKKKILIDDKEIKLEDVTKIKRSFSMVYTADTQYCENVIYNSKEVDLLIHEATYLSKDKELALERKHSTIEDALKAFSESKAKKLVLTHISTRYKENEIIEDINKLSEKFEINKDTIQIGKDGLTWYYKF